jgi:hypothetical protein
MPSAARSVASAKGHAKAGARGVPARSGQRVAPGPGNQALQAHLRAGRIHARLTVGAGNDPAEADADRMADMALSGHSSSARCGSCAGKLRRRSERGDAGAARSVSLSLGAGRPLDAGTAAFFGGRYNADFSRVRIHDDARAASSARDMHARAFTVGEDIGFAEGEYAPASNEGKRLLAHELAHVVQGAPVIRRNGGDGNAAPPGQAPQESHAGPLKTGRTADFSPCAVEVGTLSNYQLLAEYRETFAYIKARQPGENAYYDFHNLLRRLHAERARRVALGHVWLGSDSADFPSTLYQLHAGENNSFTVTLASAEQFVGGAADVSATPLMTQAQFKALLAKNRIPEVNVEQFYAMAAAAHSDEQMMLSLPEQLPPLPSEYGDAAAGIPPFLRPAGNAALPAFGALTPLASPFDVFGRGLYSENVYSPGVHAGQVPEELAGAEAEWRGGVVEASTLYDSYARMLRYRNLDTSTNKFPVFDAVTRGAPNELVSTYHTTGATPKDMQKNFGDKVANMLGTARTSNFNTMIAALNRQYGTQLTAADINDRSVISVPDDQIVMSRDRIAEMIGSGKNLSRVVPLIDSLLRIKPELGAAGGARYASWNDIQQARSSGTLSTPAYRQLLANLGEAAKGRVIGAGIPMAEIMALQDIRAKTQHLSPTEFDSIAAPEALAIRRMVALGMTREEAIGQLSRAGGMRGVKVGGGIALGLDAVQLIASGFDPRVARDLALAAPVQLGGAWVSGAAQAQWNARLLDPVLGEAMAGGGANLGTRAAGLRVFGGGAIGGPVAAATMWAQMGIQQLAGTGDYNRYDYTAKGARYLAVGGLAGLAAELGPLGFSAYCAAAGTPEAPGVGTAIGFVVGLGAFYILDYTAGGFVEQGTRDLLGDPGHPGCEK